MPLDDAARKMVEAIEAKIAPIRERIAPDLAEMERYQGLVNGIYEFAGETPPYRIGGATGNQAKKYARDAFLGKKRAVVVRQILQDLGPLTREELHPVMLAGGFHFNQTSEKSQLDGLAIALTKIRGITQMRNGAWALSPSGMKKKSGAGTEPDEEDDEDEDTDSSEPAAAGKGGTA
jgi:hypothetical protein